MTEKTYRIGDVSKMLQLNSSVLRFWEMEFTQLIPLRTEKGQRLYTEENIELLKRIQTLLHEQGMTIDGARRVLASADSELPPTEMTGLSCVGCTEKERMLKDMRHELLAMRDLLQ